jgi:hypothetical protein
MKNMIEREAIEKKIYIIRGQKVMLDKDLAELYGVPTKRLNEQVRRNRKRFPSDFMFRLSNREFGNLKSQFATSSWGGTRKLPYVFTEQGIAMLSSVLNSDRAIRVNITIMRIFVGLRDLLMSHTELRKRLNELEKKYDAQFKIVFDAIKQLMIPPEKSRRRMGFYKE